MSRKSRKTKSVSGNRQNIPVGKSTENLPKKPIDEKLSNKNKFIWCTKNIDDYEKWSFMNVELKLLFDEIIPYLQDLSKSSWGEILTQTHGEKDKSKHHVVHNDSLCDEVQNRLKDLDEIGKGYECLVSLRLNGKTRIFGFRDGAIFKLLWFDPNHEVCPSKK